MRTQSLLKSIFGVAFIAVLMSCDDTNSQSALVGRWIGVSGNDKDGVMNLLSNGTGVLAENAITWKTEKDRFYITSTVSGQAKSLDYKVQGSVLTLTEDNGEISEYAKCNKDCQEAAKEYAKAEKEKLVATLKAKAKKDSFTDSRDGKSYKTVELDKQTWMAENLNFNADGTKCYGNQESNCQKYGRLYNWETAKSACPKGWHLPSNDEWQILVDLAGGNKKAGNMLKASSGWESDNGIDAIGFAALPGGYVDSSGSFNSVGSNGFWWSASGGNSNYAYYWYMDYYYEYVYYNSYDKNLLHSVRCLQD